LILPIENNPSANTGAKKIWWRYARFLTRGCRAVIRHSLT